MIAVREKKTHRRGCGPFAYDLPTGNLDEKGQQRERRTLAPYRGSTKYSWAADERDTFSVTDGCRIEIRDRGLGSCDSE